MTHIHRTTPGRALLAASFLAQAAAASPALALMRFDFEQRFVVETGSYLKDHSLVYHDGLYHLFYTVGREGEGWGQPGNEIDFGHATSPDLVHWSFEPRILGTIPGTWRSRNLWAPHLTADGAGGYRLYYAGVDSNVVQQIGIAASTDLAVWADESAAAAAYRPDTTWALWHPDRWSNCRDPFVAHMGGRWVLLATASAKPAYAGSERGALAVAFSDDGRNFVDAGAPLVMNDSIRVLESPFLYELGGRYYLFFTEAGVSGVQVMSSNNLLTGWNVAQAQVFTEEGFAAEITGGQTVRLMSRAIGVYQPDGVLTRGVLIDTLRFAGSEPVLGLSNRLWDDWTIIEGDAMGFQPTYGDRPLGRSGTPSHVEGHYWINTAEKYGAPVNIGCENCPPDEARTGILRSRVFRVSGERMTLWVGGGADEDRLYVALRRAGNGEFLFRETGTGSDVMTQRTWNLAGLAGTAVEIEIADLAPDGHVNTDDIRERDPVVGLDEEDLGSGGEAPRTEADRTFVVAHPSPSAAGSAVRVIYAVPRSIEVEVDVIDASGRRVERLAGGARAAGPHRLVWDARLAGGRAAPRGVYFIRLVAGGEMRAAKVIIGR